MITPTTNCVYFGGDCDLLASGDLHLAAGAQGGLAIAEIKALIDDGLPTEVQAAILVRLEVLSAMLAHQGHPTFDGDVVRYSDNSPVFRLVPDGPVVKEADDYLDNVEGNGFDEIGDLADFLFKKFPNHTVEVNDPPVDEPREPSPWLKAIMQQRHAVIAADGAASHQSDSHDETP